MTTLAAPVLSDVQQMLIDARLDTIDRMLLGRVPRSDRVAIVHEVESQIQELLAERDPSSTSREDILEVLRRLDPPEAYLPEDAEAGELPRSPRFVNFSSPVARIAKSTGTQLGRLGGILGLCSFGLIFLFPVVYILVAMTDSELVAIFGLAGTAFLGTAGSIAGFALSIRGRREGVLPILGIISSAIALPLFLLSGFYLLIMVLNM
jgi:hypothetical protein